MPSNVAGRDSRILPIFLPAQAETAEADDFHQDADGSQRTPPSSQPRGPMRPLPPAPRSALRRRRPQEDGPDDYSYRRAQLNARMQAHQQCLEAWRNWAGDDLPADNGKSDDNGTRVAMGPITARSEAASRVAAWLESSNLTAPLDLSNLGLTSVPDSWPAQLRDLDISGNQLEILSNLPGNLTTLDASGNRLHRLDCAQTNLHELTLDNNQFSVLPNLPNTLRYLDAKNNKIKEIPSELPSILRSIDLSGNVICKVECDWPDDLRSINLSDNLITAFPSDFPEDLEELDLSGNRISELSEETLQKFPPTLTSLNLAENLLGRLPYDFSQQLNPLCEVDLCVNPLPNSVLMRLRQDLQDFGDEHLARFRVVWPDESAQPLSGAALDWYSTAGYEIDSPENLHVEESWDGFEGEVGASEFKAFLQMLHSVPSARDVGFAKDVVDWLGALQRHRVLRRDTFAASLDAASSCEDRVALSFNNLQNLYVAHRVTRGEFDKKMPELLTLARGMFRLNVLEKFAYDKAKRDGIRDEVEVYLAVQVLLKDRLKLPVKIDQMSYQSSSGITPSDKRQAVQLIKSREANEFPAFLASNWAPWQAVLRRQTPDDFMAMKDELIDIADEPFAQRLHARLTEVSLVGDPDAERVIGAQVLKELSDEVHGKYTRKFLEEKGLSHLLDPEEIMVSDETDSEIPTEPNTDLDADETDSD